MNKSKLGGNAHGDIARNDPGETRARLGVLGSRPPRRGAFGEGRARLSPLRRDPGPGRPEPFLFLRDLPRRGGVRGAPADAPLQALRREEQALAGRPSRPPLRQESDSFRPRLAMNYLAASCEVSKNFLTICPKVVTPEWSQQTGWSSIGPPW